MQINVKKWRNYLPSCGHNDNVNARREVFAFKVLPPNACVDLQKINYTELMCTEGVNVDNLSFFLIKYIHIET